MNKLKVLSVKVVEFVICFTEKKNKKIQSAELRRSFNHGQFSNAFFFLQSINCLKIQYSNYVFSLHMKSKGNIRGKGKTCQVQSQQSETLCTCINENQACLRG